MIVVAIAPGADPTSGLEQREHGASALVFKLRRRRVLEAGVAGRSLTRDRRAARRLLAAYRGP